MIVPKPSEEDIQHCFGVIGAQTSQPDSTRPARTYKTAQEILQIVRYKKPQRQVFAPHFKPIFPKNSYHPIFQISPNQNVPVQLIIPEEFPRPIFQNYSPKFPTIIEDS